MSEDTQMRNEFEESIIHDRDKWKSLAERMAEGIKAKEELLIIYRVPGRRPSEALFKRLEKADRALSDFEDARKESQL